MWGQSAVSLSKCLLESRDDCGCEASENDCVLGADDISEVGASYPACCCTKYNCADDLGEALECGNLDGICRCHMVSLVWVRDVHSLSP